jgi:molybdenum cofactor biosynthesis protein MoaC
MYPFWGLPLRNLVPIAASSRAVPRVERRWQSQSTNPAPTLTHLNSDGRPSMVDVGDKDSTKRTATAIGYIYIPRTAYELVTGTPSHSENDPSVEKLRTKVTDKGDALIVAQLAAIMGCKRTSELIPLCHPLQLSNVSVMLTPEVVDIQESRRHGSYTLSHRIRCTATVSCEGKTGVEMEALTAVSVGLLTVWDMLKAVAGKEMMIGDIVVSHKSGGKSGDFTRRGSVEAA